MKMNDGSEAAYTMRRSRRLKLQDERMEAVTTAQTVPHHEVSAHAWDLGLYAAVQPSSEVNAFQAPCGITIGPSIGTSCENIRRLRRQLTEILQRDTEAVLDELDCQLLITQEEYFCLSKIQKPEKRVREILNTILQRGEVVCRAFQDSLENLQTTFPDLVPLFEDLGAGAVYDDKATESQEERSEEEYKENIAIEKVQVGFAEVWNEQCNVPADQGNVQKRADEIKEEYFDEIDIERVQVGSTAVWNVQCNAPAEQANVQKSADEIKEEYFDETMSIEKVQVGSAEFESEQCNGYADQENEQKSADEVKDVYSDAELMVKCSAKEKSKADREPSLTPREWMVLVNFVKENDDWIHGSKKQMVPVHKQRLMWNKVAADCTAIGPAPRTMHKLKKCWADLKVRVKHKYLKHRAACKKAGAGPPPQLHLSKYEEVCLEVLPMELVQFYGGLDVGVPQAQEQNKSPYVESDRPLSETLGRAETVVPVTQTVVPVTQTVVPVTQTVVPVTPTVVPVTQTEHMSTASILAPRSAVGDRCRKARAAHVRSPVVAQAEAVTGEQSLEQLRRLAELFESTASDSGSAFEGFPDTATEGTETEGQSMSQEGEKQIVKDIDFLAGHDSAPKETAVRPHMGALSELQNMHDVTMEDEVEGSTAVLTNASTPEIESAPRVQKKRRHTRPTPRQTPLQERAGPQTNRGAGSRQTEMTVFLEELAKLASTSGKVEEAYLDILNRQCLAQKAMEEVLTESRRLMVQIQQNTAAIATAINKQTSVLETISAGWASRDLMWREMFERSMSEFGEGLAGDIKSPTMDIVTEMQNHTDLFRGKRPRNLQDSPAYSPNELQMNQPQ